MFNFLISLFSGPLANISKDLKDAYKSKLDSKTEIERIAADERIALLEARKSSVLAAQSDPVERWVRLGFALPCVIYINKLIIWDKVLGWGVTEALSSDLTQVFWVVLGGYFIDATVKGTAKIIKGK